MHIVCSGKMSVDLPKMCVFWILSHKIFPALLRLAAKTKEKKRIPNKQ